MKEWEFTITVIVKTDDDATEQDAIDALDPDILVPYHVDDVAEIGQ